MNHSPVLPTYPPTRRAPRATPVPTCPLYQSSSLSPYMTRRAAHDDKSDAAVMEHLQQAPPSSLGRNADPATSQPHADGAGTVRRMRSRLMSVGMRLALTPQGPRALWRGGQNRPTAFLAICCRHLGSLACSARGLPNTCRAAGRASGCQGTGEDARACSRRALCVRDLLRRAAAALLGASTAARSLQAGRAASAAQRARSPARRVL
jgi:hypothetical protein